MGGNTAHVILGIGKVPICYLLNLPMVYWDKNWDSECNPSIWWRKGATSRVVICLHQTSQISTTNNSACYCSATFKNVCHALLLVVLIWLIVWRITDKLDGWWHLKSDIISSPSLVLKFIPYMMCPWKCTVCFK
jgi:hypothetical protein